MAFARLCQLRLGRGGALPNWQGSAPSAHTAVSRLRLATGIGWSGVGFVRLTRRCCEFAGCDAEIVAALVPRIVCSPVPNSRLRDQFGDVLRAVNVGLGDVHYDPLYWPPARML